MFNRELQALMRRSRDMAHRNVPLMVAAGERAAKNGWYNMRNLGNGEAEVFIYDVIGADFWGDGVAAGPFVKDLRQLDADLLHVRINSPGGSIFDALAIRNALEEHRATVWRHFDGVGASAATWVAPKDENGKTIMAQKSRLFIHDAIGFVFGNEQDMREEADLLGQLSDDIADFFASEAGGTRDEWRAQMRAERWFSDQEAVDAGLADEIAGNSTKAKNSFDQSILAIFNNASPADPRPPFNQHAESMRRLTRAFEEG